MHCEDLEIQFNFASNQVRDGVVLWNKIKVELQIPNNSCVLLFPLSERNINMVFLKYMEQLIGRKKYTSAYILTVDEWIAKNAVSFSQKVASIKQLSEYESDCLTKYYSLIEFSNRFYVCAITKPEGRLGELLIENSIPFDEIVCAGVYRMYDYERIPQ